MRLKTLRYPPLVLLFACGMFLWGCGGDSLVNRYSMQFDNLLGPGIGGAVSVECRDGKVLKVSGGIITGQGVAEGCARLSKIKLPAGDNRCPKVPPGTPQVQIKGTINGKAYQGSFSRGPCQPGWQSWAKVLQLWVVQSPAMTVQRVYIFAPPGKNARRRPLDRAFYTRLAAHGSSDRCGLIMNYMPPDAFSCIRVVPSPAPAYGAVYFTQAQWDAFLRATPSQAERMVQDLVVQKPPAAFPGGK